MTVLVVDEGGLLVGKVVVGGVVAFVFDDAVVGGATPTSFTSFFFSEELVEI